VFTRNRLKTYKFIFEKKTKSPGKKTLIGRRREEEIRGPSGRQSAQKTTSSKKKVHGYSCGEKGRRRKRELKKTTTVNRKVNGTSASHNETTPVV